MKMINRSLMLLLVLLVAASNSFADTSNEVGIIRIDQQGAMPAPQNKTQILQRQRILLPQVWAHKLSIRAIKVGLNSGNSLHSRTLHISKIQSRGAQLVLVGHRLVSQGVNSKGVIPVWLEEVRLTLPGDFLANSWDVLSLQRELERLGIKVKPKPVEVKSVRPISG